MKSDIKVEGSGEMKDKGKEKGWIKCKCKILINKKMNTIF